MNQKTEQEEQDKAYELLKEFATSESVIHSIYRGCDPEKLGRVYYFLINSKYDSSLSDKISDLDLKIAHETKHSCNLMEWPVPENISDYPFLEERIWKRI